MSLGHVFQSSQSAPQKKAFWMSLSLLKWEDCLICRVSRGGSYFILICLFSCVPFFFSHFFVSGSVQVNGEGNQDDNHVSLFFLAIKLINHIVIQKKGAEESPEVIITFFSHFSLFYFHLPFKLAILSSSLTPFSLLSP